jgi:hypothetical protein
MAPFTVFFREFFSHLSPPFAQCALAYRPLPRSHFATDA